MDDSVIEIGDPALDAEALARRLQESEIDEGVVTAVLRADFPRPAAAPQSSLNRLMLELLAQEPLHETPFTSSAPLVGPLIVAVRRAWNWMSTKWYVRPIVQQQAAINAQLVALLNEMAQQQELQAAEIAALQARLAALENVSEKRRVNDKYQDE